MSIPTAVDGSTSVNAALLNGYKAGIEACEPGLGNPASSGHVLASTAAGVRSWVPPYASPTTTEGDIIVRGASADARLSVGSEGDVLTIASGVPGWAPPVLVADPGVCSLRLSLSATEAVPTSDIASASTVYVHRFRGAYIALYVGGSWVYHQVAETPAEIALADLTSGKLYDVFASGDGTNITYSLGAAWTNDTTRSAALAYQDGVRVLASDHGKRLLGTLRATGPTTTADAGLTLPALRCIRNEAHPVERVCRVYDPVGSWTYTLQVWRQWNNNGNTYVGFLAHPDYKVHADAYIATQNSSSSGARKAGIGLDSTSAICTGCTELAVQPAGNAYAATPAHASPAVSEGYHYLTPLEWALATGTCTWSGGAANYMEVTLWA